MSDETNGSDDLMRIGLRSALRMKEARRARLQTALAAQGRIAEATLEEHELERVRAELGIVDAQIRELARRLGEETAVEASQGAEEASEGSAMPEPPAAA